MTNKEAIAILSAWDELGDSNDEAVKLAIQALKEKAEKERRYVVKEEIGETWLVRNSVSKVCLAAYIPTREAAQRIADIYEQSYKEGV